MGEDYLRTATFRPFSFGVFLQTIATIRMERVIGQRLKNLCWNTQGQDVAEYAIMLAVALVMIIGMVRMIGTNASAVFSQVGSAIQ
jgi:Flp pilus assembly pilin Flp